MIRIPLTQQQYDAKVEQLKQEQGITLAGDSGTVSKLGVTIEYNYDGKELTVEVKDKPFFLHEAHVEAIVTSWLISKPASSSKVIAAVAMVLFAILCFCAPSVKAQTDASTAPTATLPASFYAAGASYNPSASPQFAGTLLIAKNVTVSGSNQRVFTVVDVLPVNLQTLTVSTNIGIGDALKVATIAGHEVYAPTSAGISYTGSNTGWNWTTGVAVPFKVRADKSWYAVPNVRVLKSSVAGGYQLVPGVLFGWGQ